MPLFCPAPVLDKTAIGVGGEEWAVGDDGWEGEVRRAVARALMIKVPAPPLLGFRPVTERQSPMRAVRSIVSGRQSA
jgi:hypothetical protein